MSIVINIRRPNEDITTFIIFITSRSIIFSVSNECCKMTELPHYYYYDLIIIMTSLLLWPHYYYDLIIIMTSLSWPHYYDLIIMTSLSWPHYYYDLIIMTSLLLLWPHYYDLIIITSLLLPHLWLLLPHYYYYDLIIITSLLLPHYYYLIIINEGFQYNRSSKDTLMRGHPLYGKTCLQGTLWERSIAARFQTREGTLSMHTRTINRTHRAVTLTF